MRLSFAETMRGVLTGTDGVAEPFAFEIKAQSSSIRGFIRGDSSDIRGIVRAGRWAPEAPARGTLTIVPLLGRIAYRLHFQGAGGETLLVEGHKQVTPTQVMTTMRRLPIRLLNAEGRLLAEGVVWFELRDLPAFLASWLPGQRAAARRLDAERLVLERRQLATT